MTPTGRVIALMATSIGGLILFGFAASRFGTTIYPSIYPEYGGGAAVQVDIVLKNEASNEAKGIASRPLLPRIDQDGDFLYVIACRAGTQPDKVYAFHLSEVEIVSMKVSHTNPRVVVDIPAYIRETCGNIPY